MDNDLEKTPLKDIILEMSMLEQKIYRDIVTYNKLGAEVIRRFPTDDIKETFKPLTLEVEEERHHVRSKSR